MARKWYEAIGGPLDGKRLEQIEGCLTFLFPIAAEVSTGPREFAFKPWEMAKLGNHVYDLAFDSKRCKVFWYYRGTE